MATAAPARPQLLDAPVEWADYHGSAPIRTPTPRPGPVPRASSHAEVDLFLLGLGLTGAGLVLGGAGFAVLYLCRDGLACHNPTTTVVGWALAAPGVLPLAVGLVMLYLSTNRSGRVMAPVESAERWVFGVAPVRDGALLTAATSF